MYFANNKGYFTFREKQDVEMLLESNGLDMGNMNI